MSEEQDQTPDPESAPEGQQWDAPNQQVVGLDPPWVEGTGGSPAPEGEPKAPPEEGAQVKSRRSPKPAEGE